MSNYVFPKVDLKKQPKTNFDLSHTFRTTFAPGLSIPIMDIETIPTDEFRLKMQGLIESLPMVAPALGRWKARFLFFENPMSNIYGWMDNNERLTTEEWLNRACHTFVLPLRADYWNTGDFDNLPAGVASSSLFNYLGLPVGFNGYGWVPNDNSSAYRQNGADGVTFNAEGLLTYFDIVRNYLVNNQEDRFPMIVPDNNVLTVHEVGDPIVKYYSLSVLDAWFKALRMMPQGIEVLGLSSTERETIYGSYVNSDIKQELYDFLSDLSHSFIVPFGGLVCCPYLMDFNRGIMNARVGSLESSVLVDEDSHMFSIPQLQFKNKTQNLINLLDLSGGRFADALSVVWKSRIKGGSDKPIFVGSRSEWIYMTDIISTATTGSTNDPNSSTLGQQGGFVAGRTKNENRAVCNFEFQEYGRFMCIFQLIPDVDYSAGIDLQLLKRSFTDKYMPQYAQIGYQDVSNIELTALPATYYYDYDTNTPRWGIGDENGHPYKVGKRIAWSEYMTKVDRVAGDFSQRSKFDYWVLLRRYNYATDFIQDGEDEYITDTMSFSTYVMPFLYNYLFIEQDTKAQNFRLQVYFDIKAKRPFPKRSMPRL